MFGQPEADSTSLDLEPLAKPPDLGQQRQRFVVRRKTALGVDGLLRLRVIQSRMGPDQRPGHVDLGLATFGVEVDRPHERRPDLVGQQAGRALTHLRRMQRRAGVRAVERLAASVRFGVEQVTGRDEGCDVGDGVAHAITAGHPGDGPPFDVHGLVEVHRAGRVNRQEGDVGNVGVRQLRVCGCLDCRDQDVGRKRSWHTEFGPHRRKALAQRGPVSDKADPAMRHSDTVRDARRVAGQVTGMPPFDASGVRPCG